jgi:hypothetical protein
VYSASQQYHSGEKENSRESKDNTEKKIDEVCILTSRVTIYKGTKKYTLKYL